MPDRTPEWTEVLAGAVAVVLFLSNAPEVAPANRVWIVGGSLAAAALLGPVGRSSLAERASRWSLAVQGFAFYALVAACVAFVWVVRRTLGFPSGSLTAVGTGGYLAVAVFVAARVLWWAARRVGERVRQTV